MANSYDFRSVTHFTAGTEGTPGQRVFYLQVGDETGHVSVRLEKQQVRALAQFLRSVLDDLPTPSSREANEPVPLIEPAVAEWVVGQIAVGVDEADGEVVLVVDELLPDEDEDEDDPDDEVSTLFEGPGDGARIRAHINVEQASRFIATSDQLMTRGRPPCRLCGQPIDPSGHTCPRLN
jgi:uncharacterized repeat protein (TIGR03847 family)